ncbi:hypothetical protein PN497_02940 [Sphaerospermopsis kisseleviana CS-549]|uniref:Uncharacterized protein n=3 Tax=Sphaerospermopsis TaxID=752201 RepID=A0A480A905_9CYAN|nr:hypothetical protein [Sphaerospermopsis sp. FACHB-1094]MBD2145835.1 hypothetical protein [Sphaerospermopsis sp. FACHB-1194]MDB9440338.1 hypothetical protein [Sphaerospermopsis kisseleviana CS-549]BAZ80408.1 hypothetical protein NIES73_16630 [Sphaerospermopsis kisseleviana NIES-73]GCL38604.1 hypothetical protein SR1949_37210 [Sphaerospermopsis reniformis]
MGNNKLLGVRSQESELFAFLEDILKVVSRIFITFLPPLISPYQGRKQENPVPSPYQGEG